MFFGISYGFLVHFSCVSCAFHMHFLCISYEFLMHFFCTFYALKKMHVFLKHNDHNCGSHASMCIDTWLNSEVSVLISVTIEGFCMLEKRPPRRFPAALDGSGTTRGAQQHPGTIQNKDSVKWRHSSWSSPLASRTSSPTTWMMVVELPMEDRPVQVVKLLLVAARLMAWKWQGA